MTSTLRLLTVAAAVALLVPAARAEAGTASGGYVPGWYEAISYEAAPGEENELTVRQTYQEGGPVVVDFRDTGAVVIAGEYCTSIDSHRAVCALPPEAGPDVSAFLADGADTAVLAEGVVAVYGGAGDDRLESADGAFFSWAFGGQGDDVIVAEGDDVNTAVANTLAPTYGSQSRFYGGDGDDVLRGSARWEELEGDAGDDLLDGGDGRDEISGSDGLNTLRGGAGPDRIWGGDQTDVVDGGSGDDQISGLDGDDLLRGGFGADGIGGDEGDDDIDPGLGEDGVNGGPGDDLIDLRDGLRDEWACGSGNDRADADPLDDQDQNPLADPFDEDTDCEVLTRCGLEPGGEPVPELIGCVARPQSLDP